MAPPGSSARPGVALALIPLARVLGPFIATAIVGAVPQISAMRGLSPAQAGWYTSAYFVAAAVFMMPVSRAGDLYGRGPVLALGAALIAVTSLLGAWVADPYAQIALRLLQGAGSACVFGTGPALLAQLAPPERRGQALGINITVTYIGLTAGPALGGVLSQVFGWQSIFYLTGGLGLGVALALWWFLPRSAATAPGARFDALGAVLLGATLGFFWLASGRPQHWDAVALLLLAGLLLWAFVAHQRRVDSPLIDLRLLAPGQALRYSTGAALLHYSGVFGLSYVLSLALQHGVGSGAARTGLLLAVQPVLQTLLAVPAGRLADRFPARRLTVSGLCLTCSGLALVTLVGVTGAYGLLPVALACIGIGTALFVPPNQHAALAAVPPSAFGLAAGLMQTSRLVGQMASMALAVLLLGLLQPHSADDYRFALAVSGGVFLVLCLGALVTSARRPAPRAVTNAA
ncbi:MFS transporter [Immundisolibacter sp.]|uniref:MFS transporter n=1 Tax=Immundisolibacter sp. TaxID=1934948 RepID=UPI003567C9A0